jgi:hypothetical protein
MISILMTITSENIQGSINLTDIQDYDQIKDVIMVVIH